MVKELYDGKAKTEHGQAMIGSNLDLEISVGLVYQQYHVICSARLIPLHTSTRVKHPSKLLDSTL